MRKILLGLALALGLTAPVAYAQITGLPAIYTGNELVRLTTVGGSTGSAIFNHFRNSIGYVVTTATGAASVTLNSNQGYLVVNSAPTTLTVTLPNPAFDGQLAFVANATAAALTTNVTVTAAAGVQTQTLNVAYASQTIAANGGAPGWMYTTTNASGSTGTWYRIQ